MNDLISRQDAIDAVMGTKPIVFDVNRLEPHQRTKDVVKAIEQLPSAQPDIIYCKDCKYVGTDATCCLVCGREGIGLRPYHVYHDDYCSYAERREDGKDT